MEKKNCPGAVNLSGTPSLKVKICPDCGTEVEMFSSDLSRECDNCGFLAYNDITSCVKWCKAARECVGDEMYEELMEVEKIKDQLAQEEKAKKQATEH